MLGRITVQRDGGGVCGVHAGRRYGYGVAGHDGVLGLGPHYAGRALHDRDHRCPEHPRRARPDCIDRAGHVPAQPEVTPVRRSREQAAPGRHVGRVEGRRVDFDPDLEHSRLRQVDLSYLDDLRCPN
jgi:hypothetical protein